MQPAAFDWRRDPTNGAAKFHRGIDIQTAGPGRIVSVGTEGEYGETVAIEHAGGLRTRYAHLSVSLDAGAGRVGGAGWVEPRSGRATGTHLHFEVTTAAGIA